MFVFHVRQLQLHLQLQNTFTQLDSATTPNHTHRRHSNITKSRHGAVSFHREPVWGCSLTLSITLCYSHYTMFSPQVGKELTEVYWQPGNGAAFLDLVQQLTGKPLAADAWIAELQTPLDKLVGGSRGTLAIIAICSCSCSCVYEHHVSGENDEWRSRRNCESSL